MSLVKTSLGFDSLVRHMMIAAGIVIGFIFIVAIVATISALRSQERQ